MRLSISLARCAGSLAASTLALLLAGSLAASQSLGISIDRPDPPGTATPVSVGLFIIDVTDIDDANQTFDADLIGTIKWRDERLRRLDGGSDRIVPMTSIWHPSLTFINRRAMTNRSPDLVRVSAEGEVTASIRAFVTFSSPLDLRRFPFDSQTLTMDAASTEYGPDEVALTVDGQATGRLKRFSIAGWDVEMGGTEIAAIELESGESVVRLTQLLVADRATTYYVMKVIIPLSLIVFMAWTVFWVDPTEVGPQFGVATASVLTLIAFQFSLGRMLPPVSYLTQIDKFLLGATVLVFLALGEAIISSRMAKEGKGDQARRVDWHSRWVYASLFVVLAGSTLG